MAVQKDVLVWSSADLSTTPFVGSTFTVIGTPDAMAFKDDEADTVPSDFDPVDPNQTLAGTLEGQNFFGNNNTGDTFEVETAFQITDGVNTFTLYQIDNGNLGNNTVAHVSEVALDPNVTYSVLAEDASVNVDGGSGFQAGLTWNDLAGHVDGSSGNDSIVAGYLDDDDDRIDGNDGVNDVIVGEGGGDTIVSGAGADLIHGDHVNDLPAGTTEYIVQGFVRDIGFELTSGSFFGGTDPVIDILAPPLEIRIIDNDSGAGDDDVTNERPTDLDQMIEINGVLYRFAPDYQVEFLGSNGVTYTMMVIDVDRNNDTFINTDNASPDAGDVSYEEGQILLPVGAVPPAGVTLSSTGANLTTISNPDYTTLNGGTAVTDYDDSIDAGDGNDTVFGGAGDDTILGQSGNDALTGGTGADLIDGGTGADTISAGEGSDIVRLSDSFGADTIAGGEDGPGTDRDRLDASGVAASGVAVILSTPESGTIAQTTGGDTASFTEIEDYRLSEQADTFDASALTSGTYADGGGGADILIGGSGSDTLIGGEGDDSIVGGSGDDLLVTGGGQDTLIGGEGSDTLTNAAGDDSLVGGAGNDSIVASLGNDTLEGGAGNDTLIGGQDNDSILGGADNDLIYGDTFAVSLSDTGSDGVASISSFNDMPVNAVNYEITFSSLTPGAVSTPLLFYAVSGSPDEPLLEIRGTDLQFTANGLGPTVTIDISGINLFDGGVHSVGFTWDSATGAAEFFVDGISVGTGTAATGALTPGGTFVLGQEQDTVGGLFDPDQIFQGEIYQVSLWSDIRTAAEMANDANTLGADGSDPNLVANWMPDPQTGGLTDTQNGNNMTLSGDASIIDVHSGNDVIDGGTGSDTIFAGLGSDTIRLSDNFGKDTVGGGEDPGDTDIELIGASGLTGSGVTVNVSNQAGTVRQGTDTVTFSEIESFILTARADALQAFGNSDLSVDAGAGADTIREGNGNNTLLGGGDNDTFLSGFGTSTIVGGEGGDDRDMIAFDLANDAVTVTFGGTESCTYLDSDGDSGTFSQIEEIFGSGQADLIDAGADNSTGLYLDGFLGDDTIIGGSGADIIVGDAGADTLSGGAGGDLITGDSGADSISGGAGADIIFGGTGNDLITGGGGGGGGNDTFVYSPGDGLDTITDFNAGNTGASNDGDATNNDFIDLSACYDHLYELWADYADDSILNQSNTTDIQGNAVNYSDNTQFAPGDGIFFRGASASSSSFTAENTGVVCFTSGTRILTVSGEIPIELLRAGDRVVTRDNGVQSVLWAGSRCLGPQDLDLAPNLRPIRLSVRFFGLPRDLIVSPQHAVLLRNTDRGGTDVLYRATHLAQIDGGGARVLHKARKVVYHHLLFAQHQIIFANGMPSESLYPGGFARAALSIAARRAILHLFPRLETDPMASAHGSLASAYSRKGSLPETLRALRMTH